MYSCILCVCWNTVYFDYITFQVTVKGVKNVSCSLYTVRLWYHIVLIILVIRCLILKIVILTL